MWNEERCLSSLSPLSFCYQSLLSVRERNCEMLERRTGSRMHRRFVRRKCEVQRLKFEPASQRIWRTLSHARKPQTFTHKAVRLLYQRLFFSFFTTWITCTIICSTQPTRTTAECALEPKIGRRTGSSRIAQLILFHDVPLFIQIHRLLHRTQLSNSIRLGLLALDLCFPLFLLPEIRFPCLFRGSLGLDLFSPSSSFFQTFFARLFRFGFLLFFPRFSVCVTGLGSRRLFPRRGSPVVVVVFFVVSRGGLGEVPVGGDAFFANVLVFIVLELQGFELEVVAGFGCRSSGRYDLFVFRFRLGLAAKSEECFLLFDFFRRFGVR